MLIIIQIFLTAKQGIESYMSGPEKWKQIFWFIGKKKHEGCVTVTPKLASNKDIVAGEYRESFSESDQSTYQEHQQSLVILITQEKITNYISTDLSAEMMCTQNDDQNSSRWW